MSGPDVRPPPRDRHSTTGMGFAILGSPHGLRAWGLPSSVLHTRKVRHMDHILGAELWLFAADDPTGAGDTGGLLLIATPTGKHWHWMPGQEYTDTAHLQAMALHYIGTLGLDELTVRECTTTEVYLLTREDDGQTSDDEEDT